MPLKDALIAEPVKSPIENGDAGIIIKADGSIQMFNTYGAKSEADFTPEQISVGKKLIALSVALKVPTIMDILLQMANDPDVTGSMH